jgi:hypothetical protein
MIMAALYAGHAAAYDHMVSSLSIVTALLCFTHIHSVLCDLKHNQVLVDDQGTLQEQHANRVAYMYQAVSDANNLVTKINITVITKIVLIVMQ